MAPSLTRLFLPHNNDARYVYPTSDVVFHQITLAVLSETTVNKLGKQVDFLADFFLQNVLILINSLDDESIPIALASSHCVCALFVLATTSSIALLLCSSLSTCIFCNISRFVHAIFYLIF